MSCEDVTRAVAEGRSLEDPGLRAHAAECPECAERLSLAAVLVSPHAAGTLAAGPSDPGSSAAGSPDAADALPPILPALRRAEGPLGWLRQRSRAWRLGVLATLALALVLGQLLRPRVDLAAYPALRQVGFLGALALATLLAWSAGLRPLHRAPNPRWLAWGGAAALALLPLVFALLPEAQTGHAASHGGVGADLAPRALACFLYGSAFGLPALALALAADRTGGRLLGAALAGAFAAALVGNLALQLHCVLTHPAHLALGHASLILALAPAALVWRWRGRWHGRRAV